MNNLERRVLDAIDMDALLALLCDLVAIPSLDGSPEEIAVQERVAQELRAIGMDVDMWELDFPTLRQNPAFSWEVERPRGLGVVGAVGAGTPGVGCPTRIGPPLETFTCSSVIEAQLLWVLPFTTTRR